MATDKTMILSMYIEGKPIPKERPNFCVVKRFGIENKRVYTPKKTSEWETKIAWLTKMYYKSIPTEMPVDIIAHFIFRRNNKGRPADIDNLLKSLLDGLKKGGLFKDDGQVLSVTADKIFENENMIEKQGTYVLVFEHKENGYGRKRQ
jgi:Holliday junction resolvase RusA-like endonuclease